MHQKLSRLFGAVVAALMLAAVVHGDTLVLANGDRLTGEVVREHDGVIVFRSTILGELTVPASNATVARDAVAASETVVTGATRLATAADRAAAPASPERHARRDDAAWKRQLELGLSAQDGLRDQSNLSLRLEAARTTAEGSTTLLLSHHYGKSDGFLVTDSTSANALLTRNLSDDFFVRGATRYERDSVSGIQHDAEQSLGLGYTLLQNRAVQLSVGAGAALRHRDSQNEAAGWNGLVDAFGRLKCAFTERLSLSQDFSVTAAPDDRDDYKLKSHTALVNKLTEVLQMSVRYEFEYFGTATASISNRQRFVTAIGCVF